ncbi:hypothetical protein B0H19DRAFT_1240836 [Mycena capillaripes]|nr:hypothetical protein B0H19DRAFT_1244538 [Mycena capillaripes]KAJ6537136.1 hypothetical protein B0H19DRAFT_1240836 [Mycena capillaripes]
MRPLWNRFPILPTSTCYSCESPSLPSSPAPARIWTPSSPLRASVLPGCRDTANSYRTFPPAALSTAIRIWYTRAFLLDFLPSSSFLWFTLALIDTLVRPCSFTPSFLLPTWVKNVPKNSVPSSTS